MNDYFADSTTPLAPVRVRDAFEQQRWLDNLRAKKAAKRRREMLITAVMLAVALGTILAVLL